MLWAAAGVASDRVKVEGNFLVKAFRRNEADNVLRATRAAAIMTAMRERGEEDVKVIDWSSGKVRKMAHSRC